MIDILTESVGVFSVAGFSVETISVRGRAALVFEDATVLGFVFAYDHPGQLIDSWASETDSAVAGYQLALRRAGQKAWNVYVILLARNEADPVGSAALNAIEEDLTGMRRIARAGIVDIADLRAALLPLLPLQMAPLLEAVDVDAEIRQRTTELPPRAVEAFLSTADKGVVIQIFEEGP